MADDPEIHSYLTADCEVYLAPKLRNWVRGQKHVMDSDAKREAAHKAAINQSKILYQLEKKQQDFPPSVEEYQERENEINNARAEHHHLQKESRLAQVRYATEERIALMLAPDNMIDQSVRIDEKSPDRTQERRFLSAARNLYDYLNSALSDDLVLKSGLFGRNDWWLYFVVSYRTLEQGSKLLANIDHEKAKKIGHNLHKLYDRLPKSQQSRLEKGYEQGQLLFQTHWRSLVHLLRYADNTHNEKEYYLAWPQRRGAAVDPILPFVLAYLVMQVGEILQGMKEGMNTAANCVERCIAKDFRFGAAVIEYPKMNFLVSWEKIFCALFQHKESMYVPPTHRPHYLDGTPIKKGIMLPSNNSPRIWGYTPASAAIEKILPILDGNETMAGAYLYVAEILINKRDWMLQLFIQRSEADAGPAKILSRACRP